MLRVAVKMFNVRFGTVSQRHRNTAREVIYIASLLTIPNDMLLQVQRIASGASGNGSDEVQTSNSARSNGSYLSLDRVWFVAGGMDAN